MGVQDLKIFPNRNLRCFELLGEIGDQDAPMVIEKVENGASAFFVEHWI